MLCRNALPIAAFGMLLSFSQAVADGPEAEKVATQIVQDLRGKVTTDGSAKITAIDLGGKQVTDETLKKLGALKKLRDLRLVGCTQVTDAGLKELKDLKELEILLIGGTQVTDAGLKDLKELKKLKKLGLSRTAVSDVGLEELKELKNLKELVLEETQATRSGVAKLKEALPDLQIAFKPSDDGRYIYLDGSPLGVGDPAPKLTVEFLQGDPIKQFEKEKIYVIDFWKCGCPPCRAAIPHLNELQKTYPKVVFIGIGVLTSTADNKEFAKKMLDKMNCRVAVENVPEGKDSETGGSMIQGWLEPAGQDGLPTSFIIDGTGTIAWIGHPMALDDEESGKPLKSITSGKWDLKAAAKEFAARDRNNEDAKKRIAKLPEAERDAVVALQKRAGRVVLSLQRDSVNSLRFSHPQITDARFKEMMPDLKKLKGLTDLDLSNTGVTDASLKELQAFATLKGFTDLNLCGTAVTGAGLKELKALKGLQTLNLSYTKVTDKDLEELQELKDLQSLNLAETQVTDKALKHLKQFKALASLDLSGTPVAGLGLGALKDLEKLSSLQLSRTKLTDAGLQELKQLKGIESWNLEGTRITDAGLKGIGELKDLTGLWLRNTQVTDDALKEIGKLQKLTQLDLDGTKITDAGLKELKQLTLLQSLFLIDTNVTDAGLKELRDLKALDRLELGGTKVTDVGLAELKHLKKLDFLDLARTKVTEKGVADLKSALPKVMIAQ